MVSTHTAGYFDPIEGEPYGKCMTCEIPLQTKAEADEHMSSTFNAGTGHRVSITNPDRQHNVQSAVDRIIEEAIQEALEKIDEDVVGRHGATEEEVTEALRWHSDFADDWDEHWVGER